MQIIETLINGLSSGGTYAMIALGYTMVYGIAKMLNFAHGDVIMVGGYTIYALAETITKLRNLIETYDAPVSEFALDTAAAFLWFQQQSVDFVVLETGLGGRLDATNVIPKSLVSVITNIGLDHTQYLGNTLEEIATEKCGIIKEGSPLVVYPLQEKSVLETIQKCAAEKKAEVFYGIHRTGLLLPTFLSAAETLPPDSRFPPPEPPEH